MRRFGRPRGGKVNRMDGSSRARARGLATLRIVLGVGFLWAGLEKWLNFAGDAAPWSAAGFLKFATAGTVPNMVGHADTMVHNPTQGVWLGLAANPELLSLVNFLVIFGEIAIGVMLVLGVATRLAGVLGAAMMLLFWVAAWDFQFGIVNQQFMYGILSLVVAFTAAGKTAGLDARLEDVEVVRRSPVVRAVVG